MSQTAAHLVDHVIPHVPVRQWLLSLPIPLRLLLAAQPEPVTPVLQVVQRVVTHHLLDGAQLRADEGHGGAVTLIQRFGVEEVGQTYLAEPDADGDEARMLQPFQAAAITYRIAFRPRAGHKVLTLRSGIPRESVSRQPLCADIDGFSLHAAVRVEAHDRKRLEQLCRYITRPALSDERVQLNSTWPASARRWAGPATQ